jgi:1-acyl-sn-glycerol-3-phosphate acyltransferase
LFYQILRQITATLFKVFFRKIYLIDSGKVPDQGPLLIACNHPMAFTEACLLACFLNRPLHFLVRGDVFKASWEWFFKWTNQIPIYRFRDGFSNMRRNSESFAKVHEALGEGKVILIFAEGNTKLQKKLSPLQKGAARMAFGAYEDQGLSSLKIVPVGVNYAAGKQFRSDVAIKIGEPLPVKDYLDLYQSNQQEAFRLLTDDLYQAMLPLVIHIEDPEDEPMATKLFDLYNSCRNEAPWPILDKAADRFLLEKNIASKLNLLSSKDKAGLSAEAVNDKILVKARFSWQMVVVLLLGIPLFLTGFIFNAVPFYLAKYLAFKKVTHDEFLTPVRLGLIMVLYIVWLLVWLVIFSFLFGWYALIAIWLLPLTAYVVIVWKEGFDRVTKAKVPDKEFLLKLDELLQ